ncbi:MAG: hypothetical protein J6P39_04990, partial [Oscillospiraceae bacterium]|nr:hypothetical protein [Oscillospiraceae bacterium]
QLLRYETVRITASVLEMHPDALEQRHRNRTRRRILMAVIAAGTVCVIAAGVFLRLGYIAKKEGDIAEKQTELSVKIAERTIEDLPERFAEDPQALRIVNEVVEKAKLTLENLDRLETQEVSSGEEGDGR